MVGRCLPLNDECIVGGGDDEEDHFAWDKVMTKEEFENWGEKVCTPSSILLIE